MFGFLKALFDISVLTYGTINDAIEDSKFKEMAVREGKDYYIDNHGRTRELTTGRLVYIGRDYLTNRTVMQDAKTGKIIKDYTAIHEKERKERERNERIEKENRIKNRLEELGVVKVDGEGNNPKCKGDKYRDINTGVIYAVRGYPGFAPCVFINEDTGEFVKEVVPTQEDLEQNILFDKQMKRLIDLVVKRNTHPENFIRTDNYLWRYKELNKESMIKLYDIDHFKYNNDLNVLDLLWGVKIL